MKPRDVSVAIWGVLIVCILIVSFGILPMRREVKKEKQFAEEKVNLANRLRQEGLFDSAIDEYTQLLDNPTIKDSEKINISIIVANLYYDEKKDFEKALAFYTRARFFSKGKIDRNATVNQRIVECLEKLNRSADAQYHLSKSTYLAGEKPTKYPGNVVAKIGDREITMGELDALIQKLPEMRRSSIKTSEDKMNYLKEYIGTILMSTAARRQGIQKEKEFLEQLSDIENHLLASKLYEKEVLEKIKITDLEQKYYFESHKDEFADPGKIKIAHIFFTSEDAAKKVLSEIKKGLDFDKAVKEKSEDELTKKNEGILGEISRNSTSIPTIGNEPELAKKLANLKVGGLSDVLKSNKGFHIFKILEETPPKKRSFDEVKNIVELKLKMEKENQAREEFVDKLMKAEQVLVFEGEFKDLTPKGTPDAVARQ